jgi:hypothetical protein
MSNYDDLEKKHRLQLLVAERLAADIRKAATRGRMSQGEWVRRAIMRALEEEQMWGDPLEVLASLGAPTGDIEQMLMEIDRGRDA